jgi:hypothetical protein
MRTLALLSMLDEHNRPEYQSLRDTFAKPWWHVGRDHLKQMFRQILEIIHTLVTKGDANRGLLCGVFWTGDQIAVNPLLLSALTSKSKSSINGAFQALGYGSIPACSPIVAQFRTALHLSTVMIRHWALRPFRSDFTKLVRCQRPPVPAPARDNRVTELKAPVKWFCECGKWDLGVHSSVYCVTFRNLPHRKVSIGWN